MKSMFCIKIIILGITVILIEKVYSDCTEEENLYQCEGGQKCIPIEWLCDRARDCAKGDDEYHAKCGSKEERGECEAFHFECIDPHSKVKKCVRFEWKCDGNIDCENGIDEEDCEHEHIPLASNFAQPTPALQNNNISKSEECKPDEFKCYQSNECINRDKVCDDKKDCDDGSDESEAKCSMPPIKPLIQPNLKQQNLSIKSEVNVAEIYHSKELPKSNATSVSARPPTNKFTTSNLSFNYQNVKAEATENAQILLTTSTPHLHFYAQSTQQPLTPIKAEKIESAMINPVSQIKPITFATPSSTLASTKAAYSTLIFSTTFMPKITSAKTPLYSSPTITNSFPVKLGTKTSTSVGSHLLFSTSKSPQEKQPLQIAPIIPEIVSSSDKTTSTTEIPRILKTYKMSAEAIKDKPERFSIKSQSNIIVSSSIKKNVEPIHPKIGNPIVPVNKFQILIPLSALRKKNSTSSEKSNTTVKTIEKIDKNDDKQKATTVF